MFPMLQTIIDYKLTNIKMDDIILHTQNVALMGISLFALYCCVNYYAITGQTTNIFIPLDIEYFNNYAEIVNYNQFDIYNFLNPFVILLSVIKIHAVVDLFLTNKRDVFIHHLCIIGIFFYSWYNNVSDTDSFIYGYSLLKTEISSIFLVLKYWIPTNTYAYNINSLLFYLTFLKFRIFDVYNEVIGNKYVIDVIINKYTPNSPINSSVLYISIYSLYLLNLYWFLLITKIIYKIVFKNTSIDTEKMCHSICSYIHYVNIPLAAYLYSYNKREQNIFDVSGIIILSVASFLYHYDIYEKLYTNQIAEYKIPEDIAYVYFLNDSICIHIRSFLAVITNFYTSPYLYTVSTVCGLFQLGCIYCGIVNIIELLSKKTYNQSNFLKIHYIFTFLPVGIDILAIYLNTKSHQLATPYLIVNIIIAFLFIIDPFYKLTHVAFHVMLIMQNWYICLSSNNN